MTWRWGGALGTGTGAFCEGTRVALWLHMRLVASLVLVMTTLSVVPACMVGGDPDEDAVAGDGLDDDDKTGTESSGSGIGTIAARVCAQGVTTPGIDVSYYQGVIDWARVKAGGTAFAFIRLSDGARFRDPKFASNWDGAKAAGVIRGAYQFFRPNQSVEAQAQLVVSAIGRYQPGDLPPVLDVEATGGLSASNIAGKIKIWHDLVKAGTGATPIIYTGKYFWRDEVGGSKAFSDNVLWIAQYTPKCPDLPLPWSRWTFWQNTDKGTVDGIRGKVDLDKFNGTLAQLQSFAQAGETATTPRSAALPFYWLPNADGSVTFMASPPAGATRVEIRVEDYLVGAADTAGGMAQLDYTFNAQKLGRPIEIRGLDAAGAVVAVGNGLIDSTATPEVFVNQTGELEYEIGLEVVGDAATVEVTSDGFPLTDTVSGRVKSTRGMIKFAFQQTGERTLKITSRTASGSILKQSTRTLHVH